MSKTPKVLIIEDDKFISKAMSIQFLTKNFVVKAVLNAEDGLKLLKAWIPDAIILDILLPGIDGYEFLKKVKSSEELKNIPVIVASNLAQDEEKSKEAIEYIVKSDLDLEELVKKTLKNIKKVT